MISIDEVHSRPSNEEHFLAGAEWASQRADCTRRKVGALIVRPDGTVAATGRNGSPPGGPSCLRGRCPRGLMDRSEVPPGTSYDTGAGACIALHAEQNALLRASWDEMRGSTLYVNHEPCDGCKRMICGAPLDRVIWPVTEEEREADRNRLAATAYHVAVIRAGRFEQLQ